MDVDQLKASDLARDVGSVQAGAAVAGDNKASDNYCRLHAALQAQRAIFVQNLFNRPPHGSGFWRHRV